MKVGIYSSGEVDDHETESDSLPCFHDVSIFCGNCCQSIQCPEFFRVGYFCCATGQWLEFLGNEGFQKSVVFNFRLQCWEMERSTSNFFGDLWLFQMSGESILLSHCQWLLRLFSHGLPEIMLEPVQFKRWFEVLIGNGGDFSCILREFVAGIRAKIREAGI